MSVIQLAGPEQPCIVLQALFAGTCGKLAWEDRQHLQLTVFTHLILCTYHPVAAASRHKESKSLACHLASLTHSMVCVYVCLMQSLFSCVGSSLHRPLTVTAL